MYVCTQGTKVHQAFAKIKEINGVEQQAEIFAKEILPAYGCFSTPFNYD